MSDSEDSSLSLIDKVEVGNGPGYWGRRPRVDSSHRVYVPCARSGVKVFRCMDGRLLPTRDPLKCLCQNSRHSVCGWLAHRVCLSGQCVHGHSDPETRGTSRGGGLPVYWPSDRASEEAAPMRHISVGADRPSLLWSQHPGDIPQWQSDLWSGVTDTGGTATGEEYNHRQLLLQFPSHRPPRCVCSQWQPYHSIYIDDLVLQDCAVVQSQIWLGYEDGDIAVLTSRWQCGIFTVAFQCDPHCLWLGSGLILTYIVIFRAWTVLLWTQYFYHRNRHLWL